MVAKTGKPARALQATSASPPLWEKIAILTCGVIGTGTILALVTLIPDPTDAQWKIYWVVLALTVACIGALLPGFLVIRYRSVLRAGGALACFTLVLYSSGQIKGLGGPTRDELREQGTALLHEAQAERGVLGPGALDRLQQAKLLFTKAKDGAGGALTDAEICQWQYRAKAFREATSSCLDAQHELDSVPVSQLSEQERLKKLAYTTLYFYSAKNLVHVDLDAAFGIPQALNYAAATKDLRFAVHFAQEMSAASFENNGGSASPS